MTPEILTAGGHYFNLLVPQASHVCIRDIAHALSNVCRFAGHTREFYSVAQHSVLVSQLVPEEYALHALLHDASEAYLGDVTSPLKALLPGYKLIEYELQRHIFFCFGLGEEVPGEVASADLVALATERRDLMPEHDSTWAILEGVEPWEYRLDPFTPTFAKAAFLSRFNELTKQSARVAG